LVLTIAADVGVPPYFALAIALEENPNLDALAVHENADGTFDRGIMQLNSGWYSGNWQDPETNIRAGCVLMKELHDKKLNWWQVAIFYNAGYGRFLTGNIPPASIDYAVRVFDRWHKLRGYEY
jgi:soluble lytic murein transglycosylase-like protein